jgi:hypothetical protein
MHWFSRAAIGATVGFGASWIGLAIFSDLPPDKEVPFAIAWVPAVLFLTAAIASLLAPSPLIDGETRCRKCGYILRGISEPRCPECGERI